MGHPRWEKIEEVDFQKTGNAEKKRQKNNIKNNADLFTTSACHCFYKMPFGFNDKVLDFLLGHKQFDY